MNGSERVSAERSAGRGRRGQKARVGSRHGGRVMLSITVPPEVRDALRERARRAGVSIAEYVTNALAEPERSYATGAVAIAKPLSELSYRLAQAAQALERGDSDAARADLDAAKRIVAAALLPLRRQHAQEVRVKDQRRAGGWYH